MKQWQKDIAQGLMEFREQGGRQMAIQIVRADQLDDIKQAGDRGDEKARTVIVALGDFFATLNAAVVDGMYPACGCCSVRLRKGQVCGFAILTPVVKGEGT